jgi:ATP-binding cassette subfamily B protein
MNTPIVSLRSILHNLQGQLPYLSQACDLVWTAAQSWTLAWALLLLMQGVLPVAAVYLTRAVIDSLVPVLGQGGAWPTLAPTFLLVALLTVVLLLTEVLRSLTGWVRTAQAEHVQDHLHGLIQAKASELDLSFYESPEYYDRLYQARIDAVNRPVALLENLGGFFQNGLTLLAMAGVLFPFGWWIPLLLVVSTVPAFAVVLRYTVRQHLWHLRTTADRRRTHYYDWLLTLLDAVAELRLFALSAHFQTAFQSLRQRLRTERVQLARQQALAELAAGAMGLVTIGLVMAWMLWRAAQGQISLGDVVLLYQAFYQGQRLMRTLLTSVGQIYGNILFLENLFAFLALEPRVVDPARPLPAPATLQESIGFEQVTFRYPGSSRVALDRFSLTIPAGHTVALVGANGAGKSTLIKLLCRLYDPETGSITLDGMDIREMSLEALRRQITVLFQQPVQYHTTAAENIALGNLAAEPGKAEIIAAARAAGADTPIDRLPEGYETVLGKWFGGAELSVGEWQRVALARAFLRQVPILVLDEPTSAMDSWAEAEWLERFHWLAQGRTVLIITHRFTTAMQADIIHVMDAGQIVESGRHEDLVAYGGLYAQSWTTQMQARTGMTAPHQAIDPAGPSHTAG